MAGALVAGVLLGSKLSWAPVPLVATLIPLGLAYRRPWALLVACGATGLLVDGVTLAPTRTVFERLVPDTPLTLTGNVEGCWQSSYQGASAPFRVRRLITPDRAWLVDRQISLFVPDDVNLPRCGGRLRVRGYLRPPTVFFNEPVVRVGRWRLWLKSERLVTIVEKPSWWSRLSTSVRRELGGSRFERAGGGPALARALLLGEARALPEAQVAALRRLGLGHLLAVSGLHVGLVAAIAYVLGLGLPRRIRLLGVVVVALAYGVVVGPRPSVLRAAVMAVILGLALAVRRPPVPAHALGVAVVGLALWEPDLVAELGFQLSVAATAGIVVSVPRVHELWRARRDTPGGRWGWLAMPILVTVAAQVATLPWSLTAFHRLSPVAPILNLVAMPWAAIALGTSLLWAAVSAIDTAPAVAAFLVGVLEALARPLAGLAQLPASQLLSLTVVAEWGAIGVWTGLVVVVAQGLRVNPGLRRAIRGVGWRLALRWRTTLCLVAVAACGALVVPWREGDDSVAVVLFDVGQGDAILLVDGERAVLVDAGGWRGGGFGTRVVRPALAARGIRRLDVAVVTHGDLDHCGGIVDLAREVPIRAVWSGHLEARSDCARGLDATAPVRRRLEVGERLTVGRWRFDVLATRDDPTIGTNSRSLVLGATALGRGILLTGDVEADTERWMLECWSPARLDADILKVAHHGSKSSTTPPFLAAVGPRLAVISVGRHNAYGHPAPPVLARLRRHHVPVLRTDLHGQLEIRWSAGSPLRLRTVQAPGVGGAG